MQRSTSAFKTKILLARACLPPVQPLPAAASSGERQLRTDAHDRQALGRLLALHRGAGDRSVLQPAATAADHHAPGWLWAHNLKHLELIRAYVQAPLRERAPWYDAGQKMTLVARLPRWIKSAKHRDEVLRAIDRLRASLVDGGA